MGEPYETGQEVFKTAIRSFEREKLPEGNRGSWYCPCATERHESLIRWAAIEVGATRIYDLGAGDLRLSAALADDYDVVAYETNEVLASYAFEEHGRPNIELRVKDYYQDWPSMNQNNAVFAAIGRTNELPGKPRKGVGIQGENELTIIWGEHND